jgi:hypothetical protein
VLAHERAALRTAGRDDLARKVRWVSEEDGDSAGYDTASFAQRPARDAAVVILIADQNPALGSLAGDVGLAGLSLGVQAVELLLQPFLGRLARVDGAALETDGICALLHQSLPRFHSRNPKKR